MTDLGQIHYVNAASLVRFWAEQLWHDISDDEWKDILVNIESSNAEKDKWVGVAIGPGPILRLSIARATEGSAAVVVRADSSNEHLSLVRSLVQFLNRFIVAHEA